MDRDRTGDIKINVTENIERKSKKEGKGESERDRERERDRQTKPNCSGLDRGGVDSKTWG